MDDESVPVRFRVPVPRNKSQLIMKQWVGSFFCLVRVTKVAIVGPSIWVWCRQLSLCLLCTAAFRYLCAEAPCNRTSIFFLCVFPKNDASFSVFPSQPQPNLSSHKGIRAKSGFSCEHKHIFDCNLLTQLLEQVRASMHSYDGFIGKESKNCYKTYRQSGMSDRRACALENTFEFL